MMAMDIMLGAGDDAAAFHLMVSPYMMYEARRLLAACAETKPKSLLGMMARAGMVEANYAWQVDGTHGRWMLIGQNHIVYTTGAGR